MNENDAFRTGRMPVIFAAHGAPVLLDDAVWMNELAAWARTVPEARGVHANRYPAPGASGLVVRVRELRRQKHIAVVDPCSSSSTRHTRSTNQSTRDPKP